MIRRGWLVCKTVYANLHTVRNVPLIVHARRSRDALVPLLYFRYFKRVIRFRVLIGKKPEQVLLADMLDAGCDGK